jgi:hypothetical protein
MGPPLQAACGWRHLCRLPADEGTSAGLLRMGRPLQASCGWAAPAGLLRMGHPCRVWWALVQVMASIGPAHDAARRLICSPVMQLMLQWTRGNDGCVPCCCTSPQLVHSGCCDAAQGALAALLLQQWSTGPFCCVRHPQLHFQRWESARVVPQQLQLMTDSTSRSCNLPATYKPAGTSCMMRGWQ